MMHVATPQTCAASKPGARLISYAEELTPAWLTAVLRANLRIEHSSVVAVSAQSIGNGMLGSNLRLALEYDQPEASAPNTLVAKLPAIDEVSRTSGATMNLYLKEIRFYQQIASTVEVGVPHVLFADISEDMRDFCLITDDLAPAVGVDQLSGCTVEQAELAVDAAAALHGPRWSDPTLSKLTWLDRELFIPSYRENYRALLPGFLERYGESIGSEHLSLGKRLSTEIDKYYDLYRGPWTVTHGDFRLDNILFHAYDGSMPVAILDWQTTSLGMGAGDVAYFLGSGLQTELRQLHEETLVRRYHERLREYGVNNYTWTQCWRDYRIATALGFIQAVVASMVTTRTARGDQLFLTMAQRHAMQMADLDILALL